MSLHKVQLAVIAAQPTREGGRTRELLRWPRREDWRVRVGIDEIDTDGALAASPGGERWLAMIDGSVALALPTGAQPLTASSPPLRLDGAIAPGRRVVDGPVRMLNLTLHGAHGTMVVANSPWHEAFAWRALFSLAHGMWTDGRDRWPIGAGTLLWSADAPATPWHFEPAGPGAAWWLGATPD